MNKKFAIVLALSLIAIVCCAGCIDPQDPVDPVDPVVPVDPVDPVTPPVEPVVPAVEYSVFFMLNYDGAGAYSAETVTAGDAVSKPATPTRSGYTFKGWFTAAEGGAEYDFTQAVNADLTLYAQWSKKSSSSSGSSSSGSSTPSAPTPEAVIGGQSYATVEDAIDAAEENAVITLKEIPDESLSLGGKKVTLTYPEDTSIEDIKIEKNGADQVTVEVPYTNDDVADGIKTVIFERVDGNELLVPSAAVDSQNQVGDAYTVSGLQYLIDNHVNKEMNAPVEDAPTEHVQDGWDVMFYEPAPTALGTVAESDEESVEKETTDTPESWTITLQNDIIGDVTIAQKPYVEITIEGNNHKFNGNITVDGRSARYETAALTIKNVNFEANSVDTDTAFINLGFKTDTNNKRYTNHVTVKDCTFTDTNGGETIVAIKSYTGGDKNLIIGGCTVNAGMHSMLQVTNVEEGLKITDCKVHSKNGINLNNCPSLEMSDCTFDVKGYAVRVGVNGDVNSNQKSFSIADSNLKTDNSEGDAVIVFRSSATNSTLTLENTPLTGNTKISGATADTKITIDGFSVWNGEVPTKMPDSLVVVADGTNSIIHVNDAAAFAYLSSLSTNWDDLYTDGSGKEYTNYAKGAGEDYYYSSRWTVSLDADIDLNGHDIEPVLIKLGESTGCSHFVGNGHTIKNAVITTNSNTENNAGLFANSKRCDFKNLKLDSIHVTGSNVGNSCVGVLAGSCDFAIDGITITNSEAINGKYTGGVVGYSYSNVTNCKLDYVEVKGGYKMGGIIGYICADGGKTSDVAGNILTDCTVDGIVNDLGDKVFAGGKSEHIIGKVVGNYNCNGACTGNTVTGMTTSATANIGEIGTDKTVTQS